MPGFSIRRSQRRTRARGAAPRSGVLESVLNFSVCVDRKPLQTQSGPGAVSERDPTRYGYPPVEGEVLEGGLRYSVIGPNSFSAILTPHHLGTWADQQIFNALTRGVRPSGRQLHGFMPYRIYKAMDHEELYSIIACLRSPTPEQKDPYEFKSATGHSFKGQGYR